jgi:hypothetical protein
MRATGLDAEDYTPEYLAAIKFGRFLVAKEVHESKREAMEAL